MGWDEAFERRCRADVVTICDGAAPRSERDRAWRELLAGIAPHVESWIAGSPLLRRLRLSGEDDARAVLVATIERLAARDHDNLRLFLGRRGAAFASAGDDVEELVRLSHLCDEPGGDDQTRTPLRAWLIRLVRYVERDHVRARLGWGEGDKRAAGTDAERLATDGDELSVRPPITDALTVAQLASEVRAAMAELPDLMRHALELWMADHGFAEIAEQLAIDDADRVRALVRAGHARLRDRFRDRLPSVFPT